MRNLDLFLLPYIISQCVALFILLLAWKNTHRGIMLIKKTIAPMQAHLTHQPLNNIPIATINWPVAIIGIAIWLLCLNQPLIKSR